MIDVSSNLYRALPQTGGITGRVAASTPLSQTDGTVSGDNSSRTVASQFRPDSAITDFGPKAPEEQGFYSLSAVLQSLRLSPDQLVPASENNIPIWEQLLEKQQEIADARRAASEQQAEREQQRRRIEDEQAANEQRTRQIRDAIIFSGETLSGKETMDNESIHLPGQGTQGAPASQIRRESEQTGFVTGGASESPYSAVIQSESVNSSALPDQQRIQQLFSSGPDTNNSTISLYA